MKLFLIALIMSIPVVSAAEVLSATDIEEALAPPVKSRGLVIEKKENRSVNLTINFELNSAEISADAIAQLGELAEALAKPRLSQVVFKVIGHTDSTGDAQYNLRLSERRAKAVVYFLVQKYGLPRNRLFASGEGEQRPLPGLDSADGRNRRVEVNGEDK